MSSENNKEQSLLDRLKNTYRLIIMNDETFEEVGSYRLSRLNVYLALSVVLVVLTILIVLFIFFTPIKRYIPGYGDIYLRGQVEELSKTVNEMQIRIDADSVYINNFRNLLLGEFETAESIPDTIFEFPDSLEIIERIEEDEKLRKAVEDDRPIGIVDTETKNPEKSTKEYKTKPIEQLYFIPPVRGSISQGFIPEKKHFGVDVLAPKNTAIKAVMDGIVVVSDWTLETGNTIGIQHDNNLVSFYKHNSALLKKTGNKVKAGEAIAIIGNTGELTDGPHLHFELWYNGKPINPEDYFDFN